MPTPGGAEEHDVTALLQEASGGQFVNETWVDGRLLGEVEAVEPFLVGQVGKLQVQAHSLLMAEAQLAFEQVAEEVGVGPVGGSGLLGGLIELLFGHRESQLLQSRTGLLFVGNAHEVASW